MPIRLQNRSPAYIVNKVFHKIALFEEAQVANSPNRLHKVKKLEHKQANSLVYPVPVANYQWNPI